jgi:hypothetical protein
VSYLSTTHQELSPHLRVYFAEQAAIRAKLGAAFRALPKEEQIAAAERLIAMADVGRCKGRKRIWLVVLGDKRDEPPIKFTHHSRGSYRIKFEDRDEAAAWVREVYALGYQVFTSPTAFGYASGIYHPCDDER